MGEDNDDNEDDDDDDNDGDGVALGWDLGGDLEMGFVGDFDAFDGDFDGDLEESLRVRRGEEGTTEEEEEEEEGRERGTGTGTALPLERLFFGFFFFEALASGVIAGLIGVTKYLQNNKYFKKQTKREEKTRERGIPKESDNIGVIKTTKETNLTGDNSIRGVPVEFFHCHCAFQLLSSFLTIIRKKRWENDENKDEERKRGREEREVLLFKMLALYTVEVRPWPMHPMVCTTISSGSTFFNKH